MNKKRRYLLANFNTGACATARSDTQHHLISSSISCNVCTKDILVSFVSVQIFVQFEINRTHCTRRNNKHPYVSIFCRKIYDLLWEQIHFRRARKSIGIALCSNYRPVRMFSIFCSNQAKEAKYFSFSEEVLNHDRART